ncbi:MAG: FliA/WhiG family RNA polymerase sigma factor [Planctomycetes bacterium]|nr:FliA/WhiG family RNA polymerase sigma factor [Planctomycetota bacterium]
MKQRGARPDWETISLTGEESERDRLVLEHVPLLKHIVGRMNAPAGVDRDDLYGFGMLGLIAAADSWEPERGLKFSTYAYHRVRGAILDEMRKQDALSRGKRELLREIERVVQSSEQAHGMAPLPEEIAAALSLPVEEIDDALAAARSANEISLESDGEDSRLSALLGDPRSEDPVGSAEFAEMKQLLVDAINDLPEQEKTVITLYYAEGLLLRDIGAVLEVTESRVSQIHSRALYKLNRQLTALTGQEEV